MLLRDFARFLDLDLPHFQKTQLDKALGNASKNGSGKTSGNGLGNGLRNASGNSWGQGEGRNLFPKPFP